VKDICALTSTPEKTGSYYKNINCFSQTVLDQYNYKIFVVKLYEKWGITKEKERILLYTNQERKSNTNFKNFVLRLEMKIGEKVLSRIQGLSLEIDKENFSYIKSLIESIAIKLREEKDLKNKPLFNAFIKMFHQIN
jgi:hypothetical protein